MLSAKFEICKSPTKFCIKLLSGLCTNLKSSELPILSCTSSSNLIFLENNVLVPLPSNLKYVVTPPEPSSDWKIMSLSSAKFDMVKSPVALFMAVLVPL